MKTVGSSFLGIAKHLNYRRTFLARDVVRVDIPCLPYESFDSTGLSIKIYPWSILNLIGSVRCCTLSGCVTDSDPGRSFLDLRNVCDNSLVFILGTNVNIEPSFCEFENPKFPLYVVERLKYLGKTSKTLSYELYHSTSNTLYATCDVTDVIVSMETRKPVAYPNWWLEMYGDLVTDKKAELATEQVLGSQPLASEVKVQIGDTDAYQHTNWTSYIKYCYESLIEHAASGSLETMNLQNLDFRAKSLNIIYRNESSLADTLTVKSWISNTEKRRVLFQVFKDKTLCVHSSIDFF